MAVNKNGFETEYGFGIDWFKGKFKETWNFIDDLKTDIDEIKADVETMKKIAEAIKEEDEKDKGGK